MESKETTSEAEAKESQERRVLIDRQAEAIRKLHDRQAELQKSRLELGDVRRLIVNSGYTDILVLDW